MIPDALLSRKGNGLAGSPAFWREPTFNLTSLSQPHLISKGQFPANLVRRSSATACVVILRQNDDVPDSLRGLKAPRQLGSTHFSFPYASMRCGARLSARISCLAVSRFYGKSAVAVLSLSLL